MPMATHEQRTERAAGHQKGSERIDVEQLVDCGPVTRLTEDQKDAAQEGFETFLATYRERHPTAAVPDNPTTSAVVAGLAAALTLGGESATPLIAVGERWYDRERNEKEVVVVAIHDVAASEFDVVATHQTVAEHNPEYPADDRVIEAMYVDSVRDCFSSSHQDPAELLADRACKNELETVGARTYAFPESRLAPIDEFDPHTGGAR